MTHPTKAVYGMLLRDFAKLTRAASDEPLYTERDVDASLDRIEVVDFHQTLTINGIQVRPCCPSALSVCPWRQAGICGMMYAFGSPCMQNMQYILSRRHGLQPLAACCAAADGTCNHQADALPGLHAGLCLQSRACAGCSHVHD